MDSHKEHGFSFTITDANDLPQRFSKSNPFAQHLESPEPPQTGSSVKWKTLTALDEISEALKLRTYQQELFEKVVGSSIVIYLPTGSGKTIIGFASMIYHLNTQPKKKALFLTNNTTLLSQQFASFKRTTGSAYPTAEYYGELTKAQKSTALGNRVLFMTVDSCKNVLSTANLHVDDISLIVFDECHHCDKDHPYNVLLRSFVYDEKVTNPPRVSPRCAKSAHHQILGLTASPKTKDSEAGCMEKVKALCLAMQSNIITPVKYAKDLKAVVNPPVTDIKFIKYSKPEIQFIMALDRLNHETKIRLLRWRSIHEISVIIESESFSESETTTVDQMVNGGNTQYAAQLPFLKFLKKLRSAHKSMDDLNIEEACKTIDKCLTEICNEFPKEVGLNDLAHLWAQQEVTFDECQKVLFLREQLGEYLKKQQDTKGLVRILILVARRKDARYISKYLNSNFDQLKTAFLLGKSELTSKLQTEIRNKFESGEANCVVATSVAEEGIDISECNLVVRYDCANTTVAMIQSRGRARKADSVFMILLRANSKEYDKYESLERQEYFMDLAVGRVMHGEWTVEAELERMAMEMPFDIDSCSGVLNSFLQCTQFKESIKQEAVPSTKGQLWKVTLRLELPPNLKLEYVGSGSLVELAQTVKQATKNARFKLTTLLWRSGHLGAVLKGVYTTPNSKNAAKQLGIKEPGQVNGKSHKQMLNEFLQVSGQPALKCELTKEFGKSHSKTFEFKGTIYHQGKYWTTSASASSKSEAEQKVARQLLLLISPEEED